MVNNGPWEEHRRDVLNRLEKVETALKDQDGKLDQILLCQAELKTDKKWAGKIIVGLSSLVAFFTSLAVAIWKG